MASLIVYPSPRHVAYDGHYTLLAFKGSDLDTILHQMMENHLSTFRDWRNWAWEHDIDLVYDVDLLEDTEV